ncbi:MAG: aminotransferase class V-fold PLP-dependent enzyme [Polyangiales bacterium]
MVGRVLLTGAHGLLGEATQRALAAAGRSVIAFDLREGIAAAAGVEVVRGDVRDAAAVAAQVERVDAVIHLAAVVGVDAYLARPDDVLDVNVLGTRNVLRACEARGLPVVVASTSEVYGRAGGALGESSDGLLGPPSSQRWCYATSKRAAEHYAFAAAARGLPCAVVRFFNVYGATLDAPGHERVVTRFVRAVERGEALVVHGDGGDVRAFCHVDDAAAGMLGVFEALAAGRDDVRGRAFNVGRDEPVTVAALARLVVDLTGHRPGVVARPAADDHGAGFDAIPHRTPDVSAIARATGWRAETSLDEGLRRVLAARGLLRPSASPAAEPFVPWVRPSIEPDAALLGSLHRSLASGVVTNEGPEVEAFERELAAWLGAPHVACASSGTTSLTLAAMALGLRGRAVIPSFTFVATQAALARAGVGAVLCDVDPARWTLDPEAAARALAAHPDVTAVVAVNVFGVAPDLARLGAVCRAAGVALLYDAAHGVGTRVDGARVPPEPDAVVHSFHATKVLPAAEGGAVVTRDAALDREVRRLRRHGLTDDPYAATPGLNGRMDELRAAVGRHALRGLDAALARRRAYAERLRAAAAAAGGFTLQAAPANVESNHQNLGVLCDAIDLARGVFDAHGVGTRRYFHPALHRLRGAPGGRAIPVAERVAEAVLCLALHARMDERTLARVEAAVARAGAAQGAVR